MDSPDIRSLNPDFADLLRELSAAEARYLVVGGYALAAPLRTSRTRRRPHPTYGSRTTTPADTMPSAVTRST